MSTASKVFGAAFGAGLLGFMLLGSPAMAGPEGNETKKPAKADAQAETTQQPGDGSTDNHPGQNERQLEKGGSGTQGKSESNPDGGGVDKPYAADGQPAMSQNGDRTGDYTATAVNENDFDGNNGCGNDTDFADDNNGNCGGNRTSTEVTPPITGGNTPVVNNNGTTTGAVLGATETATPVGAQVLGVQIERAPETLAATTGDTRAQVLGTQISRGAPATLAATGLPLGIAALAGVGLIGGGLAARRISRN